MSHFVTEPDGYKEPVIGESGFAARPPKTVPQVFEETVKKFPDRPAMAAKRVAKGVSYLHYCLVFFAYVLIFRLFDGRKFHMKCCLPSRVLPLASTYLEVQISLT